MQLMSAVKKTGKAVEKALMISPDKNAEMDILDKLKMEHEEVKELLSDLVDCDSGPTRKMLLKKIKAALVPHSRAEEKVVYDALIAKKDRAVKIDGKEGYYEHGLADKMLAALSRLANPMSPEFSAAAKVLKELIEHHVDEEERNIWRDVREYFDDDERMAMNTKFEAAKKRTRIV